MHPKKMVPLVGCPMHFLDERIKFIFGRDKWIKLKFWG